MRLTFLGLMLSWLIMAISPVHAQGADAATLELLRQADLRLGSAGYRMNVGAAPICDRLEPGTGLILHTLAQYDPAGREGVRSHFRMTGEVGVEGVVPGSPADRAGIRQDDTIVSIAGVTLRSALPATSTTEALVRLHAGLAALPWQQPMKLVVSRNGVRSAITLQPVAACYTRYELRVLDRFDARADGELVQISSRYLEDIAPDLLPAVVAHELSHNILRHRARLSAAGVDFGLASGFGRNVGYFRRAEMEADILSVHLLALAGYSPQLGGRFWREAGATVMAGLIRSRSHPPGRDRAAIMEAESARIERAGGKAALPAFYANRTGPLTSEWQSLLVRSR